MALAGEFGSFPASSACAVLARIDSTVGVWGRDGSRRAMGGAVWALLSAAPAPKN